MDADAETTPKPELTSEPDFRLGGLEVCPSACRVRSAAADQRVEPRVMEVLVVLVRAQGRTVSREQLIDACWGGRIVSDDAIARTIAKVRALARLAEPAPFELETIPKVGFRLVGDRMSAAQDTGRPSRVPPADAAVGRSAPRRGRLAAVLLLLLIAVAGGLLLWRPWHPRPIQNGRVEVIRFQPRQADPELRRLSDGVGEALVRVLTRAGIDTVPEVGAQDDGSGGSAELRITGFVDREDDQLVTAAQVVDRASGLVLVSIRMTRPVARAAGFAEVTANGVAAGLSCALEDRRQSGRRLEPRVLALYLNACDAVAREGNQARMLETTSRLVAAAPDLAIGHALYGIAQANIAYEAGSPAQAEALRRRARESAARALRLDPRTPKAYLAIANSYPEGGSWLERERNLLKAREIDPNLNPGRLSYIEMLREVGRLREAFRIAQQLIASGDPRTLSFASFPAAALAIESGEPGMAKEILAQADRDSPHISRGARWNIASNWLEPAEALKELEALGPEGINPRAFACALRFHRELEARRASGARGLPPECYGMVLFRRIRYLARQGDLDGAFAALESSPPEERGSIRVLFDRTLPALRRDPRFVPLVRKIGLVDYWSRSGNWPDFCREPGLPFDCRSLAGPAQRRTVSPTQNRRPTTS
jgi:DNA-binding winged helix-turn-helix (wHTH) protein/tetratricopeptide (TPR) repeat protein/TolB-like protein